MITGEKKRRLYSCWFVKKVLRVLCFFYILYLYLCHIYIHENASWLMRWREALGKQRDGSNHFATTLSRLGFLSEETQQVQTGWFLAPQVL